MEASELKTGDRVQLHPATDWWMRGARFGRVVKVSTRSPRGHYVMVALDALGAKAMPRRFRPDDILEVLS